MWRCKVRAGVFLFLLAVALAACGPDSRPKPDVPSRSRAKTLGEVPISVGAMTFNEGRNNGFQPGIHSYWSSEDLTLTTAGEISGNFVTRYEGPAVQPPLAGDFLFLQVRAYYSDDFYGDYFSKGLSDVIPLQAEASSGLSARFVLKNTRFSIPPMVTENGNLVRVLVTLTWVRVYSDGKALYFQVLPGDGEATGSQPSIAFDEKPSEPLTGRFMVYSALFKGDLARKPSGRTTSDYNYNIWIRENLKVPPRTQTLPPRE